ncbi:hypothetical protein PH547_28985 [Rhizobium sp. CNPSo 3464]|uniref:hypothetical protein n=1 Tax=Rhizobium sp. CNPSo 3464 TaxID=3021406 RepID=UPI002549CD26|nr:hypothetical protein [Rhizobium sp. CNPSo 3464]MDK4742932.1 hypothetical protein [Rhizobium sp. CNPSo 3464]
METDMVDNNERAQPAVAGESDVTTELARLMKRDLIFTMRFIGESQHLMQRHFQQFILRELAMMGVTPESHPMIHVFSEKHALMLRDFVFSGVSLSRQFRVEEVEQLTGDTMMRVDVWDELRNHIRMAESQFRTQLPQLPTILEAWKSPEAGATDTL